jgi:hypothetical protein
MIGVTIYLLNRYWTQMDNWWVIIYIYYMILGISGIAIASWIAIDGKRLERYAVHIKKLEEKFIALEKKIKTMKPRNQETN